MSDQAKTEGLLEQRRKLASLMLKDAGIDVSRKMSIARRRTSASVALSFAQLKLYFLDQLVPGRAIYNNSVAIRLLGPLHTIALERSLSEIVRRHEALRTIFVMTDGQVEQVIVSALPLPLSKIDLRSLIEQEQEIQVRRLTREEAQLPFDLARGPLIRFRLLQLHTEEHVLLLTTHHIISDGSSLSVLIHELNILYQAYIADLSSPLPELPIHYADFALWQHEWLRGERLETLRTYWQQQLHGMPALLQLPVDHPRPAIQTYHGANLEIAIAPTLTQKLKALGRQEDATLFMVLLAAFQALLHRYTGQNDIVVGSPIANRNHIETAGIIGFFANMLVLRTNLSGSLPFRKLLRRVREVTLEAYAHQDLPFEQIVENLAPERNMSYNPLFQVAFVLQDDPLSHIHLPDVTASAIATDSETSKFDLTLILEESSNGLIGRIEYSTDLFDAITITGMAEHLLILLESIVIQPEHYLAELPMLTQIERQQLLVHWNATQGTYPEDRCIQQLFEEQVECRSESVALSFEEQQLTYGELNRRANQLAHYLQQLGVGPEVLVGVCTERSIEMIVGLVGILKAGGAYVPLDPGYPQERLAFMFQDAQVEILLTQQHLRERFSLDATRLICLDSDWQRIAEEPQENPESGARPDDLAYAIYTSGSTGKPKGITIPHRAISRLVFNTNYIQLTASARIAQASNASFDAATFEIWGALLHGAQLIGISREVMLSVHEFATQLHMRDISILFLTTALFNQIAQEAPQAFDQLETMLFGGEAVDPQWVRVILKQDTPCHLLHVYGPTESTTFTTWYEVQEVLEEATTVPIGRPITNTQIYLLDRELLPVPIGIPGEVYIGGAGLARDYLHRPDLTAERFLPHPFSEKPGARLYRTGDLARYRRDGALEFLGRTDQQVKLRGFRIELGEIEIILSRHAMLREAIVVIQEDGRNDKALIAYIVPADHTALPSTADLRSYLKQKLPSYMIPSAFVMLDTLPLNPHGKIDVRALPKPQHRDADLNIRYVAPRTATEEVLATIWAETFQRERVGIHENFFELGGHSLMATRMLSRIYKRLQVELPMRSLFEAPTIAELAQTIEQYKNAYAESPDHPDIHGDLKDIEALLTKVENMTEEEATALINKMLLKNG